MSFTIPVGPQIRIRVSLPAAGKCLVNISSSMRPVSYFQSKKKKIDLEPIWFKEKKVLPDLTDLLTVYQSLNFSGFSSLYLSNCSCNKISFSV